MNDLLIVYNTFGMKDNFEHYKTCIQSILDSKITDDFKVVISSCYNSDDTRAKLISHFKNNINYVFTNKRHTVNITFNRAVQEMVKTYGEFKNYLYVDSGIDFIGNKDAIQKGLDLMKTGEYAMVSYQVSNDHALDNVGIKDPLIGKNYIIPFGSACNGHCEIFSNDIFKAYNNKIIPDVFAAYCTESVYPFLCAGVLKKWVIVGDHILRHAKGVDGASSSNPHYSQKFGNPWNNLLFDRNVLDFVNDQEAIDAGLGYEECGNIMMHNKEAYVEDYIPKNPEKLREIINKYLYLSSKELDYSAWSMINKK